MTPEGPSIMKRSRFMKLSESLYVILYPICMAHISYFLSTEKMMLDIFLAILTMASCGFMDCLYLA